MTNLSSSVSGSSPDDTVAGKPFIFYWHRTRWLSVLAAALYVVNLVWEIHTFLPWVSSGVIIIWLNYWLARRYRVRYTAALVTGVVLGVIGGFLLALADIIWYHKAWYLLNLIRLPLIGAGLGLAVSGAVYLFFLKITINNTKN